MQSILPPQAARWSRALAGREGVKLECLGAGQGDMQSRAGGSVSAGLVHEMEIYKQP